MSGSSWLAASQWHHLNTLCAFISIYIFTYWASRQQHTVCIGIFVHIVLTWRKTWDIWKGKVFTNLLHWMELSQVLPLLAWCAWILCFLCSHPSDSCLTEWLPFVNSCQPSWILCHIYILWTMYQTLVAYFAPALLVHTLSTKLWVGSTIVSMSACIKAHK